MMAQEALTPRWKSTPALCLLAGVGGRTGEQACKNAVLEKLTHWLFSTCPGPTEHQGGSSNPADSDYENAHEHATTTALQMRSIVLVIVRVIENRSFNRPTLRPNREYEYEHHYDRRAPSSCSCAFS
jgi:hypothetical protein